MSLRTQASARPHSELKLAVPACTGLHERVQLSMLPLGARVTQPPSIRGCTACEGGRSVCQLLVSYKNCAPPKVVFHPSTHLGPTSLANFRPCSWHLGLSQPSGGPRSSVPGGCNKGCWSWGPLAITPALYDIVGGFRTDDVDRKVHAFWFFWTLEFSCSRH